MNQPDIPTPPLSFAIGQAIGHAALFIIKIAAAVYIIRAMGGLC